VEVLVMTPEVLLHVLCHAGLKVRHWLHNWHPPTLHKWPGIFMT
jgi:hypothetical protein